jgi:single-strand DNA-binding protein
LELIKSEESLMSMQKQILFYGRLGKEPELKYTPKQIPVCHLAVAEDVEGEEKPHWHKVIVWGKQAETCKVMLQKGGAVFVRGRVSEKEFKNEAGEIKRYREVSADKVGYSMEIKV